MDFTQINGSKFTSTGVAVKIPVPSSADYFRVQNITQAGTTQVVGVGIEFEWYKDSTPPQGQIRTFKDNGGNGLNMTVDASGGFVYVPAQPLPEAPVVGTAITQAAAAAVTMPNTYSNGDRVTLYSTTGMLQIGGMSFTISSVTGAGFTLLGLNSSAFAAAATAVTARRISPLMAVEPEFLFVTGISQAAQAVVTVSIQHLYVVGQLVHFRVPPSFGMTQITELTGKIVQATGPVGPSAAYQFIVDIDSSAFTAFTFPASTLSPTAQLFATIAPAGQRTQFDPVTGVQTGYNFTYPPFHSGQFFPYMYLPAGVQSPAGSSGDVIEYQIFKYETT